MSTSVPINSFDRGKPFYPLIMNYLVLLIGFKDLAGRGAINILKKKPFARKIDVNLNALTSDGEIISDISKIIGPLDLKSEFQGNHIKVDIDEIANDLVNNVAWVIQFTMHAAGSLLILAHEVSKDKPWHDRGLLWEFLRHCRNAAAHGGLFTFKGKEPCRRAEWGHFRIERGLEKTPLFKDANGSGLLAPGDPIRLLWDIEQEYPDMKA